MSYKLKILIISIVCFLSYSNLRAESVKVFFNQPEESAATSKIANPDTGIDDALVDFIQTAKSSDKVYICLYSSTTEKITNAINTCASVVGNANIFHIMEEAKGNNSDGAVNSPGIYTFANSRDDGSNESPLMHNKFAVIIDTNAGTGRVWTGSYNPTDNGTLENNNNAIWIESYEPAKLFADEFIYMWNGGNGKFSTDKSTSPNTAKSVTVGDVKIDVYFSPYPGTDTSMKLKDLIDNATHSIFFNMFTFASDEERIKNALIDAHNRGIEVKGVLEASHAGSRIVQSELKAEGLNVVLDANRYNLHHKFCVIDYGASHSKVITGSYNWSDDANTKNDENFLIIHSPRVAELYWQEFQKNYALSGISDDYDSPAVSDVLVYPSPAENIDAVTIGYTLSGAVTDVLITVYTLSGERVIRIRPEFYPGTYNEKKWDLVNNLSDKIAPGLYIIKVSATTGDGTFFDTDKFAVIR